MTEPSEMTRPVPGKRRWCGRFLSLCQSGRLHHAAHAAWVAIKCGVVILLLAWLIGIPGHLVAKRLDPLAAPYHINISRVTFNPFRGILLHRPHVTHGPDNAWTFITADTLVVRPEGRSLLHGQWQLKRVLLENGKIFFPLHAEPAPNEADAVVIQNLNARLDVTPENMAIHFTGRSDLNTVIEGTGDIARAVSDLPGLDPSPPRQPWPEIHRWFNQTPEWMKDTRGRLHEFSGEAPPRARLQFNLDPDRPGQNWLRLEGAAQNFRYRDRTFTGVQLDLEYRNQAITLSHALLQDGDRRLLVEGSYQIPADRLEARIYGDLQADKLNPLLPDRWRNPIAKYGIDWKGSLHAEAWVGPCRLEDAPTQWGGWITMENSMVNQFPIERLFASFKRSGTVLAVNDFLLKGGSGPGRGEFRLQLLHDYEKQTSRGEMDLGIEMRQLKDFLTKPLRRVADMFTITDHPVQFQGGYTMHFGQWDSLIVTGKITGRNIRFRGSDLVQADAYLTYSNHHVILDPFTVNCATGGVEGSLHLDLGNQHYGVNLAIDTDPRRVSPMAGKHFDEEVSKYVFSDDIMIRAHGLIDTKRDKETDLQVVISGRQIGTDRIRLDHLYAEAHRGPGRLTVSNITSVIAGGSATGSLVMALGKTHAAYALQLDARDLSFDRIASIISTNKQSSYEGTAHLALDIQGRIPDDTGWPHLTGSGNLRIENGRLLMVPVFGGLSSFLSRIYPGLGFSEQNLAEASLRFRDSAVFSDDFRLVGNMISLSGRGSYAWRDQLDFTVRVHPFRDGSLASLVRVVTIPISMLLEFNVTGTRQQPVWGLRKPSSSNEPAE